MNLEIFSYACYEYKEHPLFFVKIPQWESPFAPVAEVLRALDEFYGDTPQETTEWALEYQLWARMLLSENALMLNPKHIDINDVVIAYFAQSPETFGTYLDTLANAPIRKLEQIATCLAGNDVDSECTVKSFTIEIPGTENT